VGEALWRAGYRLHQADLVAPPPDAAVTVGLSVRVERARPMTLLADGQTVAVYSRALTVEAVLAEAGLPLVGLDYSVPAADGPPPADGLIRVVRVREEVLTEQDLIPRETVYQALPEVEIDTVQVLQAGADGVVRRYLRVRYEDGVEVTRATEGEVIAQAASPRVIGYGSNLVIRTVDTPDGPIEYWRALTFYATSYSPSRAGVPRTARNFGITASGRPLTIGLVAIDRSYVPFGTRLYVPGYGYALAADTGGGVKGRWIDLGYDDWNYKSWHQVVTVYFVTPVPPADQIRWIMPSTVP
jgi:3D (Asp-Asp-Asp) domain-containing protein